MIIKVIWIMLNFEAFGHILKMEKNERMKTNINYKQN